MNIKTFIYMILTFRRVDPIPRNIGLMLSTTFWISIVWIISNFTNKINRKRLIGNTYQIYRSILHQLAIDENWNNVYSGITLPSGDMGTIKVERVDDERESKGV
ncbi:MAG: hypothetical protein [Bacteriophage sp.]|nr:MAG: hypothetical protein [Bacteriophage sp.]